MTAKRLFLTDSLGAAMTAVFLALVLARFEDFFGMPAHVLYILSMIAGCYSVYSFLCFRQLKENHRPYLKAIALANIAYCVTTAILVFRYLDVLTPWGGLYFVVEIVIIVGLAVLELRTASKTA